MKEKHVSVKELVHCDHYSFLTLILASSFFLLSHVGHIHYRAHPEKNIARVVERGPPQALSERLGRAFLKGGPFQIPALTGHKSVRSQN